MLRPLVLFLVPLMAVAAPVPKNELKAKIESKFGKMVDPKADSTFELDNDALKITLTAKEDRRFGYTTSDGQGDAKRFDHTPRVEFARTGDFDLRVRVNASLATDAETVEGKKAMHIGGGVKLVTSDGSLYWCGMVRIVSRAEVRTGFRSGSPGTWSNDFRDAIAHKKLDPDLTTAWLRVVRKGESLTCAASKDGDEWVTLEEYPRGASDGRVDLALYAEHCSSKAHTVTLDQFSIEKPKK